MPTMLLASRKGAAGLVGAVALLGMIAMVRLTVFKEERLELLEGPPLPMGTQLASPPSPPGAGARMQELNWLDEEPHPNNYVVPMDVFLFWGKSSFKGHGAVGRISSAQRVRQVLNIGHFTGNSFVEDSHGHGKFITEWDGAEFRKMSRTCCVTLVVPPMEDDLPLYDRKSTASRNIRFFVSNGNRLVLTGGSYLSIVFLNL